MTNNACARIANGGWAGSAVFTPGKCFIFFSLKEPQRVEKPVCSSDIKTFSGFQRDKRKRDDVGPAHSPEVRYCLGLSHFVSFVSQAARNSSRTHLFLWVSSI